jgi:prefoldin subunit 5
MPIRSQEQYEQEKEELLSKISSGFLDPQSSFAQRKKQELKQFEQISSYGVENVGQASRPENIRVPTSYKGILRSVPGRGRGETQERPTQRTLLNNAADAGVDITTGLSPSIRGKAALLSVDPGAQDLALNTLIQEELKSAGFELPEGVPAVFPDRYTGELAYLRPQDGKLVPTLVNPPGADLGDVLEAAPTITQAVTEAGAAFGGATLGGMSGSVPGAVAMGAGAAAGANYLANYARKELARGLGVDDKIVDQITNDEMLKEALVAGGFELAIPGALGAVNMARNLVRPGAGKFTREEVDAAIPLIQQELDTLKELYRRTGVRLDSTTGAATQNPKIIVMEKLGIGKARNEAAENIAVDDLANLYNTERTLDSLLYGHQPGGPIVTDPATLGAAVQDVTRRPLVEAQAGLQEAEEALGKYYTNPDVFPDPGLEAVQGVRGTLRQQQMTLEGTESASWERFRELSGYDKATARSDVMLDNSGDTPIKAVLAGLDEQAQTALSNSLKNSQQSFITDLGYRRTLPKNGEEIPFSEVLANPKGYTDEEIAQVKAAMQQSEAESKLKPEGLMQDSLGLGELHFLLSHLKQQRRNIDNNPGVVQWRKADLDRVINAVQDQIQNGPMRRGSTGKPVTLAERDEVADSFITANNSTVNLKNFNSAANVRQWLELDPKGNFKVEPDTIRKTLFTPGNSNALSETLTALGNSPQHKLALLKEMQAKYAAEVFDAKGKFMLGRHRKFLQNYQNHLSLLTGGKRVDAIDNAAALADVVRRQERSVAFVEKTLKDTFGGAFIKGGMSGQDMSRALLAPSSKYTPEQTRVLVSTLEREAPDLLNSLRYQAANFAKSQLTDNGVIKPDGLEKFLTANRGRLTALFSGDYVAGLDLLSRHITNQARAARGATPTEAQTAGLFVFRSIFGPLSTIQRRITAGLKTTEAISSSNARAASKLMQFIEDPEKMRRYLLAAQQKPGTVRRLQAVVALGGDVSELGERDQELYRLILQRNPNFAAEQLY